MPVPIRLNMDKGRENTSIDYSFLLNSIEPEKKNKKIVTASNSDATLLFDIWSKSEKINEDTFKVDVSVVASKDILRLKTRGFLTGGLNEVHFTPKGKTIITTMVLGETNRFEKGADKQKSYTEILASMDKRGKKGYRIPKYAANNSNRLRLS